MFGKVVTLVSLSLALAVLPAGAADRVEKPESCHQCGMDRGVYARSRMVIVYADGTNAGTCSLNCAVTEMKKNKEKKVNFLKIADYATKNLIDATRATWVVGGSRPGVMTVLAKWAFDSREEGQKFVKENGGRMTTFDEALELALKENE